MSEIMSEGGCHCGAVKFRVRGAPQRLVVCSCSMCTMKAYLHWFVSAADFELLTSMDEIATYTFNTGTAKHHFCRTCGVASFYVARSHPDGFDVNARCVKGLALDQLPIDTFDGKNWDAAYERYRELPD